MEKGDFPRCVGEKDFTEELSGKSEKVEKERAGFSTVKKWGKSGVEKKSLWKISWKDQNRVFNSGKK